MTATTDILDEYCTTYRNWGRWGVADQKGTANFITPARVAHAATLVHSGR
jgi:hypothetical protein